MTVVSTSYLKSHPAMKQEFQQYNVEQSDRDTRNILNDFCKFGVIIQYVRYDRCFIFWEVFDIEGSNVVVWYFLWV